MALKRNEPDVKELTKKEYENNRGIKQTGPGGEGPADVGEAVDPNPVEKIGISLSGENTKKEIIAELLKRGLGPASKLGKENKKMLLGML